MDKNRLITSISGQLVRQREDIGKLKRAIDEAEQVFLPRRGDLLRIYQDIVMDAHLTAVMEQRLMMTLSREFKVVRASDGVEVEQLTDVFKKPWFSTFCRGVLETVFYGFSFVEFGDVVNGEFSWVSLRERHLVFPERQVWMMMPNAISGIDFTVPPYSEWYMFLGQRRDLGLLMKAAYHVLAKRFVTGAWAEFAQVFGMPTRVVKPSEGSEFDNSGGDRELVVDMVSKVGPSAVIGLPPGWDLMFQANTQSDAFKVYQELVHECNRELSKLVLGQTMTTEDGSSRSQAEVHLNVANNYAITDMRMVKAVVNAQLLPFMVRHGIMPAGLFFDFDNTERLGLREQIAIDAQIANMGHKLSADYLMAKYGVELVVDDLVNEGSDKNGIEDNDAAEEALKKKSPEVVNVADLEAVYGGIAFDALSGYEACCGVVNGLPDLFNDEEFEGLLEDVFEGKVSVEELPADYVERVASYLVGGAAKGFRLPLGEMLVKGPATAAGKMRENLHFFAAGKSALMVENLGKLLYNDEGERRLYGDFRKVASKVVRTYNREWLAAEYHAVVGSAQAAEYWERIEEEADVLPNLRYITIGDANVRPEHAKLNNVVRPVGDAFWKTNMPPNGWGCRCWVEQVGSDVAVTPDKDVPKLSEREQPAVFRVNAGIDGKPFSDEHPYFKASRRHNDAVRKVVEEAGLYAANEQEWEAIEKRFDLGAVALSDKELAKVRKAYSEDTTMQEIMVGRAYTTPKSFELNKKMRAGEKLDDTERNFRSLLSQLIKKNPVVVDTVYRGIVANEDTVKGYVSNTVIKFDAFTSTSLDQNVANEYARKNSRLDLTQKNTGVVFAISKAKGGILKPLSVKMEEEELLINYGSAFFVTEINFDQGIYFVKLAAHSS